MLAKKIMFNPDVKVGKVPNGFQIPKVIIARRALDENDRLFHGSSDMVTSGLFRFIVLRPGFSQERAGL